MSINYELYIYYDCTIREQSLRPGMYFHQNKMFQLKSIWGKRVIIDTWFILKFSMKKVQGLGAGRGGRDEIRKHYFFQSILLFSKIYSPNLKYFFRNVFQLNQNKTKTYFLCLLPFLCKKLPSYYICQILCSSSGPPPS